MGFGGYPLPALAVRPPENPLEQYGQVSNLASLAQRRQLLQGQAQLQQGDIQLQQQKIQDQNAMTAAIKQWDGGDMHALPDLVKKNGGSANAVLGLQSNLLEYDKGLAQKTEADLKNEATKNDMIAGHIDTIKGLPPEQQPQAFSSAVQDLAKRGYLDPQSAANLRYPGPDGLDALEKIYQSHASQVSDKLKESEGAANQAKLITAQREEEEFRAKQPGGTLYAPTLAAEEARLKAPIELQTAIAKETNPSVLAARTQQAVATEIAKQKALAPELQQITNTTRSGRAYINREDIPKEAAGVVEQQAAKAGVPVVDKDVAGTLSDIDTAKANQDYMLGAIGKKLASDPVRRLYYGPGNTIEKLAQTDPELAAMGTFRNAAIQSMRAVAGSKGLRINQYEVQLAVDNDIPKMTDTLPVAQQKLTNLKAFLENTESAHLQRNRGAGSTGNTAPPAGATHIVPGRDGKNHYTNAAGTVDLGIAP